MGGIEDNRWVDMMIDKIGFALTKVDESIQKSIELWKELTKDIYDEQPNNGKPGEEDSSRDKSVTVVKERPIQHWAMRLGEAKESTSQNWSMCDSKFPESLIQEQEDDEVEEKEKEDDEGTVSESSGEEDMCELTLGNSGTRYRLNRHHLHNEEASTGLSLKWKDGYEQLKDDDKSWGDDSDDCENLLKSYPRVPLGSCYLPPAHPLHKENNAVYFTRRNPYHMSTNDDTSSKQEEEEEEEEETKLETSGTSYSPSGYHHRNEEDTEDLRDRYEQLKRASSRARDGYELLKNDDTSSEDDDEDSWNGEEDVAEYWSRKYRVMSEATNISLVDDDDDDSDDIYDDDDDDDDDIDDDDLSDKLQGFVDVKEEEIENKTESGEVETISPEGDWVYVTRE